MRNIKALCPVLRRNIQVLDDWYPSYKENGKLYVNAFVSVHDATEDEFTIKFYNACYTDKNGNKFRYEVRIAFWGADDTGIEKVYYTNDLDEAIKYYRQFKKILNKLKKQHPKVLKWYLLDDGFEFI